MKFEFVRNYATVKMHICNTLLIFFSQMTSFSLWIDDIVKLTWGDAHVWFPTFILDIISPQNFIVG